GVEQQQLVPAEDEAGERILRPDGTDVEATNRVLAAKEQLLEDRQTLRSRKRVDVLHLTAQAERQAARLLEIPDAFECRLVKARVAPESGQVDRRGVALSCGRKDWLVDRIVDDARRHFTDDALAVLPDEQRIAQERIARQH